MSGSGWGRPAQPAAAPQILVVTTPYVAGWRVQEVRGAVFGLVVRSRGLGGNIMAGLRSLGGGEIKEYTQLLEESRAARRSSGCSRTPRPTARTRSSRCASTARRWPTTCSEIVAYGTAWSWSPTLRVGPGRGGAGCGCTTLLSSATSRRVRSVQHWSLAAVRPWRSSAHGWRSPAGRDRAGAAMPAS